MVSDNIDLNGACDLAGAIILQAAKDYDKLKDGKAKSNGDCNLKEIEQFFRSSFFEKITNGNGEYIFRLIAENKLRKRKPYKEKAL